MTQYIDGKDISWLLSRIIGSFHAKKTHRGLPLGNLTSQLLVNIYMNEFDQFVKHKIKAQYYIRYADDFVVMSQDKEWLVLLIPQIKNFLWKQLKLTLHPKKVSITTLASGVDFLGWTHFGDHRVLRTVTKRRMMRNMQDENTTEVTKQSYRGLLKHGNTKRLQAIVEGFE